MKTFSLVSILLISLGLTFNLHAAVTVIHDWQMGENDPGAASGHFATNTLDSIGGSSFTLTNQPATGTGGKNPSYTNLVSGGAAFFAGSDLSEFYYTNGQYAVGNVIPNLTTNFGLELSVYPTASTNGAVVAYDGNTGSSGWGIFLSNGTNCYIFFGGVGFSAKSAFLATNVWTDVALVSTNVGYGLHTTNVATLYTNGVAAFNMTNTPANPSGNFLIAGDNSGSEDFSGAVDEVRVFTFAEGQFSPTNLLVYEPLVVTTTGNSGPGTLRGATAAATAGNSIVTFTNTLSSQAILLSSNSAISLNYSVTIDASALPGGIQINGQGRSAIFNVASGVTAILNSLTIANGYTNGNGGGGINNAGRLTLNQCTLSGNSSQEGGGIDNEVFGTVTLNQCTLSRNTTSNGNGDDIYNDGLVTLNECTLSGNIETNGYHTCIVNNGTLDMVNSIVGNNGTLSLDIENNLSGTWNCYGANLVEESSGQGGGSGIPIIAAPGLAPLGNYGGPTQTMPPLPGSPAIGAGSTNANTFATDQRGYPRVIASQMDIGAVEGIYNAGASVLTNATSLPNGSFQFGFTNYEDMTFNVFATTNLALPFDQWVNLGYAVGAPAGSGQFQFTDTGTTNSPQRFYQVVSP